MSEHDEQSALFHWAEVNKSKHPGLSMMFAIPNGGHRHISVARKLKVEGVKSGVPDIFLAYPSYVNHTFSGLFIEMKREIGGRLSKNQREWIIKLNNAGYKCSVCLGWIMAANEICMYLGLDSKKLGV